MTASYFVRRIVFLWIGIWINVVKNIRCFFYFKRKICQMIIYFSALRPGMTRLLNLRVFLLDVSSKVVRFRAEFYLLSRVFYVNYVQILYLVDRMNRTLCALIFKASSVLVFDLWVESSFLLWLHHESLAGDSNMILRQLSEYDTIWNSN